MLERASFLLALVLPTSRRCFSLSFDHSPLPQAMQVRLYLLSTGQTLLQNIPEMFAGFFPSYVRGNEIK